MALETFYSFSESLIRVKNRFVKFRSQHSNRNPEVIPNIPVVRNRNGPYHFISDQTCSRAPCLQESLAQWKAPRTIHVKSNKSAHRSSNDITITNHVRGQTGFFRNVFGEQAFLLRPHHPLPRRCFALAPILHAAKPAVRARTLATQATVLPVFPQSTIVR